MSKRIQIKPSERNTNRHTDVGMKLLEHSISQVGAIESISVTKEGTIISGHARKEKFDLLGYNPVEIELKDNEYPVIRRNDILDNTKKYFTAQILANTTSKKNIDIDTDIVEVLAEEYDLDIVEMGVDMPIEIPEAVEDDYVIPDKIKTDIVLGDLFEIGQHRLLCGSSTDADNVKTLMGGAYANIMASDPPYGVNLDQTWRNGVGSQNHNGNQNLVKNDDIADWTDAYSLFTGNIAYVWHATKFTDVIMQNLRDCNFIPNQMLILNKSVMVMGRNDYHWKHEPCWYAIKKGSTHHWIGDRKQVTVIDAIMPSARAQKSDEDRTPHPTQKPVLCMSIPIGNHDGDVYDPFLGSGTTMVASHQLNRKCYGMELDPCYCQVIIDRMLKLDPNLKVTKNGEPYQHEAQ